MQEDTKKIIIAIKRALKMLIALLEKIERNEPI